MKEWFRRMAEVPHLNYTSLLNIDRSKLKGFNHTPKIEYSSYNNEANLAWPLENGSTSGSPASNWKTLPLPGETKAQHFYRQTCEALELPGTLSDYHFIIQGGYEELWKYRRYEQWLLPVIDRLCWLDLHLIETYPSVITNQYSAGIQYLGVRAFSRLVYLYEREGYLNTALEIAQKAARLNQGQDLLEKISKKIASLEAENDF